MILKRITKEMRLKWCITACRRLPVILGLPFFLLSYLLVKETYPGNVNDYEFTESDLNKHFTFSTDGDGDVMVFLHMQKTGGTFFGKNLVKNLKLKTACRCLKGEGMLKCPCMSEDQKRYWLFSRYSTGWKCGLHADYTELTECLNSGKLNELEEETRQRRYYYVSVLRDPAKRFISEWQHVSRGASWMASTLRCNGRSPSIKELPFCFSGDSWRNVTLEEFLNCPHNLARNRQTRMLANLSVIDCYSADMMDDPQKRLLLLNSAKDNLRSMPYFSIISYLNESQYLFERTFNLEFRLPMYAQKNRHNRFSGNVLYNLSPEMRRKILEVNDLDVQLYDFAERLFLQRYQYTVRNDLRNIPF
ncbi:heparan-sulfate 6-O-sulfotransferase 2-like isoform X2 [Watersipora subatra]